ncbi:hypothetical protein ERJ75_001569400 [Trypanosoma vivax]|nr:hypothetical protein ERJ75_001569200 [Trypanosoma vivax]KAH8605905.1 hypothetical protein ERJ75_001569400 [Trypanosoma vivax]
MRIVTAARRKGRGRAGSAVVRHTKKQGSRAAQKREQVQRHAAAARKACRWGVTGASNAVETGTEEAGEQRREGGRREQKRGAMDRIATTTGAGGGGPGKQVHSCNTVGGKQGEAQARRIGAWKDTLRRGTRMNRVACKWTDAGAILTQSARGAHWQRGVKHATGKQDLDASGNPC